MQNKLIALEVVICGIVLLCGGTSIVPCIRGSEVTNESTMQTNQHLLMLPNENSLINGYVTDNATGEPLEDVFVSETWRDDQGQYHSNDTITDSTGYYLMHSPSKISFDLYFHLDNYFSEGTQEFYLPENETFWYNISLIPYPPVTVHFHGYITDNSSGEPIEGVYVNLYWHDYQGHYYHNNTQTNASGYYSLGSIPGTIHFAIDKEGYFGYDAQFDLPNNSTLWFNVSLVPMPPVSSVVCGYVTDAQTGEFLTDVQVHLDCATENGYFYNYTWTNDFGFYRLGTIPGRIYLYGYKENYSSYHSNSFTIDENQTRWMNFTMDYQVEETAQVKGYVVDNLTSSAIYHAFISVTWKDNLGHFSTNSTLSDRTGYYEISVPDGSVQCLVTAEGYLDQRSSWMMISEGELWYNARLAPEISVEIIKPHPGLYVMNHLLFPLMSKMLTRFFPRRVPLVIGPIEITVNVTRSTLGCNRVEFFIDNRLVKTDTEAPFTYLWKSMSLSRHTVRVVAYDNAGPCDIKSFVVRKVL